MSKDFAKEVEAELSLRQQLQTFDQRLLKYVLNSA